VCTSSQVLDVFGHNHPRVHAVLVDRVLGTWERWVGEGSDWKGDELWGVSERIEDGRATRGAEIEVELTARVAGAYVLAGLALDSDSCCWKASLGAEDAPGAPLACQAVTHRDAYWVADDSSRELATGTRGSTHTLRSDA
jgi:hypothetical protein